MFIVEVASQKAPEWFAWRSLWGINIQ